jgi:cytochrome c biogenesis protein
VRPPQLGPVEWLRWGWRQLTSMRTALLLLLLLAIAAVPGSVLPQTSADPNGVTMWKAANPGLVPLVNAVQGFDVYTSAWFSAIYLLLFTSLVGCVLPRVRHHLKALRAAPPRTPSRLERLPSHVTRTASGEVETALAAAEALLRARRYRIRRYGDSISAERGYLRESGNLVFHGALVGLLVAVSVGSGFAYTGQRVVVTGQSFVNSLAAYDSFSPGRFITGAALAPYTLQLQHLAIRYEHKNPDALGAPLDYTATVRTRTGSGSAATQVIKVNEPLDIAGTTVFLLGNGYAPHITVRNADGRVSFSDYIPFLPQDSKLTSLGVIKVPDGAPKQIGLVGFLYPTVVQLSTGADASLLPSLGDPLLSLSAYTGDLGLNSGVPSNAYALNTARMTKIAGPGAAAPALQLRVGSTAPLPGGLGTVRLDSITRFASFEIHRDPAAGWVALFVFLSVAGLIVALLVPRRRLWVKVGAADDGELRLEYAGLARGDDAALPRAVADLADDHARALESKAAAS